MLSLGYEMALKKIALTFVTGLLVVSTAIAAAQEKKTEWVVPPHKAQHTLALYKSLTDKVKHFFEDASQGDYGIDANKLMISLTKEFGKGKYDNTFKRWNFTVEETTIQVYDVGEDGNVLPGTRLPQVVIAPTPDLYWLNTWSEVGKDKIQRYLSVLEFSTMDWLNVTAPKVPGSAYYVMAHISHFSPFGGAPDEEGQLLARFEGRTVITNDPISLLKSDGSLKPSRVTVGVIPFEEPVEVVKTDKDVFRNGEVQKDSSTTTRYWGSADAKTMQEKFSSSKPRAIWIGKGDSSFLLFTKVLGPLKN